MRIIIFFQGGSRRHIKFLRRITDAVVKQNNEKISPRDVSLVRFPAFQKAVDKTDVGDIDIPKYNDQDIKNKKGDVKKVQSAKNKKKVYKGI